MDFEGVELVSSSFLGEDDDSGLSFSIGDRREDEVLKRFRCVRMVPRVGAKLERDTVSGAIEERRALRSIFDGGRIIAELMC